MSIRSGTGTDQTMSTGYTNSVTVASLNIDPTNQIARYSVTGTVPSNATQVGVIFSYTPSTPPAGASDIFVVTNVQLEEGAVATRFRRNGANYDQELSACKRYFWALTPATLPGQIASLHATGSTTGYAGFIFGHTFRVAPSMTVSANNVLRWHNPGVSIGEANSLSAATGVDSMQLNLGTASGLGFGGFYAIEWTSGSGFIYLSAEL
jgi:hypothetical protein